MPLQGCWWDDSGLLTLPGVTAEAAAALQAQGLRGLRELVDLAAGDARRAHDLLQRALGSAERAQAALQARFALCCWLWAGVSCRAEVPCCGRAQVCKRLPAVAVTWRASRRVVGAAAADTLEEPGYDLEVQLRCVHRRASGSRLARVYAPRFPKACGLQLFLCLWCALPQAASTCVCAVCQVKEEGWWLVLGDAASQELHAVKRLSFAERTVARLVIPARTAAGAPVKGVTLHLARLLLWQPVLCLQPMAERLADRSACGQVSDAYLGLDQRHDVEVPGSGAPAEMHGPSRQAVRNGEAGEPASAAVPASPAQAEVTSCIARARDAAALALQGPGSRIARNIG